MSVLRENAPLLWLHLFPFPQAESHKYSRGTALIRGGASMTGAARLMARAAQRIGAGLVSVAAPLQALPIYAEALESVIVRPCDDRDAWQQLIRDTHVPALGLGPGLGLGLPQQDETLLTLACRRPTILDADALTNFADEPQKLLSALHPACVLTPHEGEFSRVFGIVEGEKQRRAMQAAKRAGCVVLLKGSETMIASPDGEVICNRNAPPWLATGGSGDVLAGMVLGLLAQGMPIFWAASAAAWIHGEVANRHGIGLIAEDLVAGIPEILAELFRERQA